MLKWFHSINLYKDGMYKQLVEWEMENSIVNSGGVIAVPSLTYTLY